MSHPPCGASGLPPRAPTATETVVLVVIVIVSALLAVAGFPALSVVALVAEAASLGVRLLYRLRGSGPTQPGLSGA
ncbi:hypothetical protein [Streptomyces sp. 3N207]|uniref:hypothetical protein n=1 Tax=Streptomyces sp. 3N207 TaxID=3457417 RepID=UPI003FD448B8